MALSRTAYHLARRYKGGIRAVAGLMDMSEDTLEKKLNPNCTTHKLHADEAEAMSFLTGDPALAIELARSVDMICVPAPGINAEGVEQLVLGFSRIGLEFSQLVAQFNDAIKDNTISVGECDTFQGEAIKLYTACMAQLARMRALAASHAPVMTLVAAKK